LLLCCELAAGGNDVATPTASHALFNRVTLADG